jgi:undecaprenyl-diphosphatase
MKIVLISFIFWVPVIIFLKLAGEVIEKEPLGFDTAILTWFHAHATAFLDQFFLFVTNAGGITSVLIISALIFAYLLYKKRYYNAQLLLLGLGGASAANVILKALFHRDRPSLWHQSIVETGFSFPSGHAMASAALVTCLVIILWSTKWRWLTVIIGAGVVVLIGASRLYLGVHYPSDILAGWCVSVAWVLLVRYILRRWHGRRVKEA